MVTKKSIKDPRVSPIRTTTDRREAAHKRRMMAFAARYAADAHENNFSSRRGLEVFRGVLCYYNNNPFTVGQEGGAPYDASRDWMRKMELALIRTWLAAQKFEVLAEASYPPAGAEGAGYTTAMIVNAPASAYPEMYIELQRIVRLVYAHHAAVQAQQTENQTAV